MCRQRSLRFLDRTGQHAAWSDECAYHLEAVVVSLETGIWNADKPDGFVTGANVRDQDTELLLTAFQLFDSEIVLRHLFSP